MGAIDDLITSISGVTIEPEGPMMLQLTSRLASATIQDDNESPAAKAAYYYALNLSHISPSFIPLSSQDFLVPRIRSVLTAYSDWFAAEDTELLFETLPEDPWELSVISRMMVGLIFTRARAGDGRMPACSPQDHPCSPFWVERGKYDGNMVVAQEHDEVDGDAFKNSKREDGDVEMI